MPMEVKNVLWGSREGPGLRDQGRDKSRGRWTRVGWQHGTPDTSVFGLAVGGRKVCISSMDLVSHTYWKGQKGG